MTSAKAFAPGNISCIFKIYKHKNPRFMGSYGVGFTVNEGVVVDVAKSDKTEIIFNNKKIDFPTVVSVVYALTNQKVNVTITSKLPIGCGFGVSGASALASAYALNKLLQLKKTKKQMAIIAHTAEAKNKTGLGDVVNQYFGGFLFKKKPSSYFSVVKIPVKEKYVYCRVFSPLSTKEVLSDVLLLNKVEKAAAEALQQIVNVLQKKNDLVLQDIFSISKKFVMDAGLLKNAEVIKTIEKIEKEGGAASMIILGNAVMSTIPFPGATKYEISDRRATLL